MASPTFDHLGPPDKSVALELSYGDAADNRLEKQVAQTTFTSTAIGTPVDVKRRSNAGAQIRYTKGDETNVIVRFMVAKGQTAPAEADVAWQPLGELSAPTAGERTLEKGTVKLTPASFDAEDGACFSLSVSAWDWVRADVKRTGGTGGGAGTVFVGIAGGWGL